MSPKLTRKLTLEAPQRVADGAGGYTTSWRVLGTHWAEIRAAKGREVTGEAGPLSRVPMTITIRAFPVGTEARPKPGQRLVEGTRRFAIRAVAEMDANARYLELACDEEIAA